MKLVEGVEEKYKEYVRVNSQDPYSHRCVTYGEEWADLMEAEIEKGAKLEDIAESTSRVADTDGITMFMYGCAVNALAHAWIYGEQLRIWYNLKTQFGKEGEKANKDGGVLNPAILTIGEKL